MKFTHKDHSGSVTAEHPQTVMTLKAYGWQPVEDKPEPKKAPAPKKTDEDDK